MAPAQQRLERHHVLGLDVDDRLVMHFELPRLQRGTERCLDRDALLQPLIHRRAEQLEIVAAAVLRLVHRGVGVAQQLAHVEAVARIERYADAHRGDQRAPVDHHRGAQCLIDALGRLVHLVGVLDVLHHHHELIAPHAHHQVIGAHGRADALRDGLQELVAGLVTARVVDVLEAVEIEEQRREQRPLVLRRIDGIGQVRREIEPVGEPGELVVVREVIEVLMTLEQLALDHAAHGHVVYGHREHRAAVEVEAMGGGLDVAQ